MPPKIKMSYTIKPKILELDFGMGNIRSLQKAFEYLEQPVCICDEAKKIKEADAILLPGDGAFGMAMKEIKSRGFYHELNEHHQKNKPIFGICIGFQILFSGSTEFGEQKGLNFLPGTFSKIETKLPVPHIGWSKTKIIKKTLLTQAIPNDSYFYYVHSYALKRKREKENSWHVGICTYEEELVSIIEHKNLFGVQFHPEKSQKTGLNMLKNFLQVFE